MRKSKTTLITYVLVGGFAYLMEMGSLYYLVHVTGLSPLRGVAISFWVGFAIAFIMQKLLTFKNYDRRPAAIMRQLLLYCLLVAFNYGFTLLAVKWLSATVSVFVIRTLVIGMITCWNFVIYHFIFKPSNAI
ncbi:MAG TPA: GtrA family protein [Candidatus Limnocylindrales bacterium]|nr:GtrA family protein [Candidatus Limnocylindrales bacterium]